MPSHADQGFASEIEIAIQAQRLRWVAIGCDPARKHGELVPASILHSTIEAATDPAPPTPGVINGTKGVLTYGFMTNCTSIAAAVSEEITKGRVDWRILGVKVALYDDLR
jgi:hypothetical protein